MSRGKCWPGNSWLTFSGDKWWIHWTGFTLDISTGFNHIKLICDICELLFPTLWWTLRHLYPVSRWNRMLKRSWRRRKKGAQRCWRYWPTGKSDKPQILHWELRGLVTCVLDIQIFRPIPQWPSHVPYDHSTVASNLKVPSNVGFAKNSHLKAVTFLSLATFP